MQGFELLYMSTRELPQYVPQLKFLLKARRAVACEFSIMFQVRQTLTACAERTMALLAFEDTRSSPVADLMDISQRQKTASELNAAILSSQCQVGLSAAMGTSTPVGGLVHGDS